MIVLYSFNLQSNNILDIRVYLSKEEDLWGLNKETDLRIPEDDFIVLEEGDRNGTGGMSRGLPLASVELTPDQMSELQCTTLRDAIFEEDWPWEDLGMILHVLAERGKRKWPG